MNILKKTLEDYSSIYVIDNLQNKINNIITDLFNGYKVLLCNLNQNISKNNINIIVTKNIIVQSRYSVDVQFYKFDISVSLENENSIIIANNKLNNIINNIIIPVDQYNKMVTRYTNNMSNDTLNDTINQDNISNLDSILWIILYRYQLLSSNNNQLAVLQNILDKMETDFNLSCECFASGINGSFPIYSSIYYDVEKYFGSIGSFFNIVPIRGTYSFNPPYQFDIITNGIIKNR